MADASSWEALQHLVRNLDNRPFLVLLTARPVELSDHPIGSEVVFGLEQEGLLTRLALEPLGDRDIAALVEGIVGESPPAALVEWLGARARGNPLFAGGLVRALLEEGADLRAPELRREGLVTGVALADGGPVGRRAEVKFRLAGLLAWGTGELEEAERVCAEAVDLFREADEDRMALLATNELTAIHGLRGDFAAWRSSAEAALAAALERGERGIIVQALGNVGIACWHQADFDAAEPAVTRCVDMVRRDAKPHRLCLSLLNVAASRTFEGRLDGVLSIVAEAKSVNSGYRDSQVPEYEVFIGFVAGDFRASLEVARTAYWTNPSRPGPRRGFADWLRLWDLARPAAVAPTDG